MKRGKKKMERDAILSLCAFWVPVTHIRHVHATCRSSLFIATIQFSRMHSLHYPQVRIAIVDLVTFLKFYLLSIARFVSGC